MQDLLTKLQIVCSSAAEYYVDKRTSLETSPKTLNEAWANLSSAVRLVKREREALEAHGRKAEAGDLERADAVQSTEKQALDD